MNTASLAHIEPTAPAKMSGTAVTHRRNQLRCARVPRTVKYAVSLGVLSIGLALLSGCSDNKPAEPEKPVVKPPDLVGARSGFQRCYIAARGWNQDAQPYRIESISTNEGNGRDGKWAEWRSSFASPSAHAVKNFTWSGSNAEGAPSRGINPSVEDSYSPSNASTQIFDVQFLKIDSDQALETAKKHGGDKLLQENPDLPVTYICDFNRNTNKLVWHVIFGPAREGAKLVVSVDASTGDFIRVEK